ncbi:MAG: hypothetical protein ABIJ56_22645 [Pseudomonadota bacterium]
MWRPEKKLVEVTAQKRDDLLVELLDKNLDTEDPQARKKVLELFQAIGMRHVMGLEDVLSDEHREAACGLVSLALESLDPEGLLSAAENLVLRAPELLMLEDEALKTLEDELEANLKERDSVELVLSGARAVLGREPELPLELETAILTFEDLVRDELWRLLPLGRRRAAGILWAEPSMRQKFWWWVLGQDLPETALEDLSTAARIIHLFPKARQGLEAMIEGEKAFEVEAEARQTSGRKDISLREHILKSRYDALCRKETREGVLKLAADEGQELVLVREPETSPKVAVSSNGRRLIVDIEPPHRLKQGKRPVLEAQGQKPLELMPTERGRYEAPLDEVAFQATTGKLVIALDTDEIVLEIPFKK